MKENTYWIIFQILIILACIVLIAYPIDGNIVKKDNLDIALFVTFISSLYIFLYTSSFIKVYKEAQSWINRITVVLRLCLPAIYIVIYLVTMLPTM